jgi:hypothetical protein
MVQAWRVGDERAETYLGLLAEAELRRAGDRLRGLDAAAGTDLWSDPGMAPFTAAESAAWKVIRAGRILVVAGALDRDFLGRVWADLPDAIKIRSRLLLNWDRRRGMLHTTFGPSRPAPLPCCPASGPMRVAPIGRALLVAGDRAATALHLMSLVATRTEAVITVVMRVSWPPGRPGTDREIARAGPHHLPYDQLWAVDDQGTRYAVRFEEGAVHGERRQLVLHPGQGGTATWRGIARLSPVPPGSARRLDLVGDGTRLIQLSLRSPARRGRPAAPPVTEPVAIPPGERLLVAEAERILASGDARGPVQGPVPGEIITVLTQAGAIAADSPVPGQLAALCQRLGAAGHGITAPPAPQIPAPWASVIAHRDAPVPAGGPEVFAPLACVLPDLDGARFALAGLSTAAGRSYLHVISRGMPPLTERFAHDWTPGFSWWLRDGAGNWHVATAAEPCTLGDGMQAFGLRLTPPLAAVPDAAEIVVTGPATRVRATVPVAPAPAARRA